MTTVMERFNAIAIIFILMNTEAVDSEWKKIATVLFIGMLAIGCDFVDRKFSKP